MKTPIKVFPSAGGMPIPGYSTQTVLELKAAGIISVKEARIFLGIDSRPPVGAN